MLIVTKESLHSLVSQNNQLSMHAVGRALVHLFNRQTEIEQKNNTTNIFNNKGFAGPDAYRGSLSAKYYLKHGKLEDWQLKRWISPNKKGYAYITKYWRQLNEEAERKQQKKV